MSIKSLVANAYAEEILHEWVYFYKYLEVEHDNK